MNWLNACQYTQISILYIIHIHNISQEQMSVLGVFSFQIPELKVLFSKFIWPEHKFCHIIKNVPGVYLNAASLARQIHHTPNSKFKRNGLIHDLCLLTCCYWTTPCSHTSSQFIWPDGSFANQVWKQGFRPSG